MGIEPFLLEQGLAEEDTFGHIISMARKQSTLELAPIALGKCEFMIQLVKLVLLLEVGISDPITSLEKCQPILVMVAMVEDTCVPIINLRLKLLS